MYVDHTIMIFRRSCDRGGVPQECAGQGPEESAEGTSRPREARGEGRGGLAGAPGRRQEMRVSLERNLTDQESKLAKARQSTHDARVDAQGALQEILEARKIAAGKAFIMQRKYMKERFLLLT